MSKAAPPVVAGPARGRGDVARAKAAAASAASAAPAPAPADGGETRCPICLEDWDVNGTKGECVLVCCCKGICGPCGHSLLSTGRRTCPLCRAPKPPSDEAALAMLRRNAENENPAAVRHLGDMYRTGGHGLVPSQKKSARFWRRAADLGDVGATYSLGVAYHYGHGVRLDAKQAARYYRLAADRGHASARCRLGDCYVRGTGVPTDRAEAARFYRLAAEQGLTEAMVNLGMMYESDADARRWFARAAAAR